MSAPIRDAATDAWATAPQPSAEPAPPEVTPAVEVRDLHFHYGTSDGSLHDLTFHILPGESVALVGPNGAGKSTLLLHLNGILPERQHADGAGGDVLIFGQHICPKTLHAVRRDVGLLFQDPDDQLFCPTVFDDVAFGPQQYGLTPAEVADRVRRALAQVGLAGFERRSPHRMSGGEKRRACLAGVLACQPRVLALDEPTSNLDPRGRREFKSLLATINATKLIATHDLELALEMCPRTLLLDAGRLIADGPTAQLLADEPLMLAHGLETPASLRVRERPNP